MQTLTPLIQIHPDSNGIVRQGSYRASDSAGIGGTVMRFLRSIGQRGTLTMPQEVREVLDVQEGDIVEFEVIAVRRRGRNEPSVALSSKSNPTNLLEGPAQ